MSSKTNISCLKKVAIEFIIELIKHSRSLKIKWVFAGDGSKYKWLKDNINKNDLGELVEILGRRPLEEMPNLFHENNFSDQNPLLGSRESTFTCTIF